MSGAMRRIGEYLGLLEDTGYDEAGYDDYGDEASEPARGRDAREAREPREPRQERPVRAVPSGTVADLDERRRPVAVAPQPVVAELSRITTLHPTTYNEARSIGEEYREGTPVIMNLTEMDDADAKRLVDFAAGLIFATRGSIERVTNKVFLLSPPNVTVAAEDKQAIAADGFFNQS
ncbi:cell division protein SepF [Nocardioides nitrophenolicus]|uniref:cell division protein SepF n=1 Tax=Nocardioides nitrophenolicus TaxID=60489 RepID=UPI00195C041E|nr:cell division protein SepF [Nocardioides nitrophenolicus]MBM7515318.1 cell division inhibitor SepF [Nocardioides nitrophenolicus]